MEFILFVHLSLGSRIEPRLLGLHSKCFYPVSHRILTSR